ncbi:MAG: substrate-binding domain-containing protein [Acutalibacteraceae bacterium]|nr:substrate-binding domain-containing protein [Acutalibacteraceae bacterium]
MNFRKMLSIIMVAVLCLTLFSGCGEDKNAGNNTTTSTTESAAVSGKTITLVGGMENMGFYENLKKGGEEAAKKYGFSLEYIGIEDTEQSDSATHIKKLKTALENEPSGVVITPMGEGYGEVLSEFYDEKIPVVQIDSIAQDDIENLEGKNKNPIVSTVATDYKQAGAICAEKMFETIKADIKKAESTYVVGVIEREDADSDEEKTDGFVEKFSELADADDSTKGKYRIETEDGAEAISELKSANVKAVFITHPEIADKISDTVFADKERYKDITFCGFDSGAKQLKWLESDNNGKFIGGVAQNSYDLGYNAVEQCIFSIQRKELKSDIKIEGQWYDKTNTDKMMQDKFIFQK